MTAADGLAEANPVRYVCMPGSPYTGSTLLGFLLNEHPSCASIGAATGLTARVDVATYVCSCGTRFLDCPFWNRIAARTVKLGHPVTVFRQGFWNTHVRLSRRRSVNGVLVSSLGNTSLTAVRDRTIGSLGPIRQRVREARASSWSLATAVLEATGASVFVDTARDHQRPKHLSGSPMLDLKVIHLVRDPRGNAASIMKHTGVDAATAARQWRHYNLEADRVRRMFPPESWLLLHYEELCADPQGTLDRIARFVGVAPAPVLWDGPPIEHHIIGNSMRLRGVEEIREDRAWETTLDAEDLRVIAELTLPVSRRLGFDWPATRPRLVRSG
jgi:hypothetical protein